MSPADLARASLDLVRVACTLPLIEAGTRLIGPRPLVDSLRAIGRLQPQRDPAGRARLRRVIGALDARVSTRSKCYRRALIEIALDKGAAAETLHIGLYARGNEGSGHAWLDSEGPAREAFDVIIRL